MRKFQFWLRFLEQHLRIISYSTGSIFIVTWTLLRFFSQRMIFDLVGQQVLTHQWLQGSFGGATIGTTNYILKMLFLYAPVDLLPGSARLKMIVLALIVNLATFILLGVLLEKILAEFNLKPGLYFYAALVWLAAIAGSVFWIQFTNSRNLEVVGGVGLVYGGLRFLRKPSPGLGIGLAIFSSVLFFDDSLQVYMIGLPLLVYAAALTYRKQSELKLTIYLLLTVAFGLLGSRVLFLAAHHLLALDFVSVSGSLPSHQVSVLGHSLVSGTKATIKLYAGAPDGGRSREIINLLFLGLGLAGFFYASWRKKLPRRFIVLLVTFLVFDELIYLASGQASLAGTQRYLIMTGPFVVLAIGSIGRFVNGRTGTAISLGIVLLLLINGLALGAALGKDWDTGFPNDAHLASVNHYLRSHSADIAYASMDTALPLTYLNGGAAQPALLPLDCSSNRLIKSSLFYDKTTYRALEARPAGRAMIILDGSNINNAPSVCPETAIANQLGVPASIDKTGDGSLVLFYPSGFLHFEY